MTTKFHEARDAALAHMHAYPEWDSWYVIVGDDLYDCMWGTDEDGLQFVNILCSIDLPVGMYVLCGNDTTYGTIEGFRCYA